MMRQFILGLIVAALAWWGYGKWVGSGDANTGPETSNGAADANLGSGGSELGQGGLEKLLQSGAGTSLIQNPAAIPAGGQPVGVAEGAAKPSAVTPRDAGAGNRTLPAADLDELLTKIAADDLDAIGVGWRLLAAGRLGVQQSRVTSALAPKDDSFPARLRALGSHNAFVHSDAGRRAAKAVLQAAVALPDAQAVKAGSQLVYLMTRGRIERGDLAARKAVDEAYAQHRIRVDRWMCNPTNVAGARSYTVKSGDSPDRIASRFRKQGLKVEGGTIMVLNRIRNARALRAGQQVKIPVAPMSALLEKRSYALMVFVGDELLRLYWVGHGRNDHTPVTSFTVVAKQDRPQWTAPDGNVYPYGHPQNILGEYFIKFAHPQYTGFGAHGTPQPETICTQSSAGCIRMKDDDIDELFRILPRGAKVVVQATESLR